MNIPRRMQIIFKIGISVAVLAAAVMFFIANREAAPSRGTLVNRDAQQAKQGSQDGPKTKNGQELVGEHGNTHDIDPDTLLSQIRTEHSSSLNSKTVVMFDKDEGAAPNRAAIKMPVERDGKDQQKVEASETNVDNDDEKSQDVREADDKNQGEPGREKKKKKTVEANPQQQVNEQKNEQKSPETLPKEQGKSGAKTAKMHLAVVACGDHLEQTLVLIKSAVLLSRGYFIVHIYAEEELQPQFDAKLSSWPADIREKFGWKLYDIQFPEKEHTAEEWKKLFKKCASQRLFFPDLMPDQDALLYVDTDILFMRPIDDIWEHFTKFNSTHIAALAPEHESPNAGWYNRFARHPYYGPLGVNSGVMLMNVTRMRAASWLGHIVPYYKEYKLRITWGDQDLINIFFHFFPQMLYVYDCDWNYRPDHCMYMSVCKQAETRGVSVVHGCRGVYHNEKQPAFKVIYQAIQQHKFGDSLQSSLIPEVERRLAKTKETPCGRVGHVFTHQLKEQVKLAAAAGRL